MNKKIQMILAQLNFTVGDIQGNLQKHLAAIQFAQEKSADVIIFSELSLTGYPPEDLLLRPAFIEETERAFNILLQAVKNIHCIVGHPYKQARDLYNACSILYQGKIIGTYAKQFLPNYGVFDEKRYFTPGKQPCVVSIATLPIGLIICEDLWHSAPIEQAKASGAKLIIVPNASPFEINKHEKRLGVLTQQIAQNKLPIVYVNQMGGQDELIFDGGSLFMDKAGNIREFAGFFNEALLPLTLTLTKKEINCLSPTPPLSSASFPSSLARIYDALCLSVRDYILKNHFPGVLIGLSGGLDSALTLSIAVDALGKEKVAAVMMPARYTSELSLKEAKKIAENLNIEYDILSIDNMYQTFLDTLSPFFAHKKMNLAKGATEENIQARCRAIILMGVSNQSGRLVLTTSNRSEMAVGYCTLYGDMAGGFAVLKNVPKTLVYELAHYRNTLSPTPIIPLTTIERAPTAELAPQQRDEDALAPYATLDAILHAYIHQGHSVETIIEQGFEKTLVEKIIQLVRQNEYKRHQAPIGPHLDLHSFGKDWRYPLTNGFK